jgi:hypothetical protein
VPSGPRGRAHSTVGPHVEQLLESSAGAHFPPDGTAYQRTGAAPPGPRRLGWARCQMARKRAARESANCPLVKRIVSVYRIALGRPEAARAIDRRRDAACSMPADRHGPGLGLGCGGRGRHESANRPIKPL